MSTARIQDKGQVTIPTAVRRQTGLCKGDLVDFAVKGNKIVITPKDRYRPLAVSECR